MKQRDKDTMEQANMEQSSGYEMEELLPVLAELAEKTTGYESSSVSYEKAEQLMEAVLYCIREADEEEKTSLLTGEKPPADVRYRQGLRAVKNKVERTLQQYHEVLEHFDDYENRCLRDTFVKGIPEFFRWYDIQACPQNTILTLDYPVLGRQGKKSGIDEISDYIRQISLEQLFLENFGREYVLHVLQRQGPEYKELIQNIAEAVLEDVMLHLIAGKAMDQAELTERDWEKMLQYQSAEGQKNLQNIMEDILEKMVVQYYENSQELLAYLRIPVRDIAVRISCRTHTDTEHDEILY